MTLSLRAQVSTIFVAFLLLLTSLDTRAAEYVKDIQQGQYEGRAFSQYAIYFSNQDRAEVINATTAAIKLANSKLKVVTEFDQDSGEPQVELRFIEKAQELYAPPSAQYMDYFGYGLNPEDVTRIVNAQQAILLNLAYDKKVVWSTLQSVNEILTAVQAKTGGYIWDAETREIFTVDAFTEKRYFDPESGAPVIEKHTVIHSYDTGQGLRAITLGMVKFGLPDIVMTGYTRSDSRLVGNGIVAICQLMAEGQNVNKEGYFLFDLQRLKNQTYRTRLIESTYENATLSGRFRFTAALRDEGDPENQLLQPEMEHKEGDNRQQDQALFLSDVFGWKDNVAYIKHNQKILAASAAAKNRLPRLFEEFNNGLETGEYILLKAPFKTADGGNEWMWVEVSSWKNNGIDGILQNEPRNIPGLRAGAKVSFKQSDVFDYIFYRSDGSQEGNETGELILKYQ